MRGAWRLHHRVEWCRNSSKLRIATGRGRATLAPGRTKQREVGNQTKGIQCAGAVWGDASPSYIVATGSETALGPPFLQTTCLGLPAGGREETALCCAPPSILSHPSRICAKERLLHRAGQLLRVTLQARISRHCYSGTALR